MDEEMRKRVTQSFGRPAQQDESDPLLRPCTTTINVRRVGTELELVANLTTKTNEHLKDPADHETVFVTADDKYGQLLQQVADVANQWKDAARTYFKTHKRKRVVNGWTHYKMQNLENKIKRIIVELRD